jgi:hypothetical protein
MSITYNPLPPKSLPPYRGPSLPPSLIHHRKPHSQRKSSRRFQIFPYCRRFPTTNAACARFRRARKVGSRKDLVTPIALACQLTAVEDMLTAAKTACSSRIASIHTRLRALIDEVEAVRPIFVTNPSHFSFPNLYDSVFIPHSLSPDK